MLLDALEMFTLKTLWLQSEKPQIQTSEKDEWREMIRNN